MPLGSRRQFSPVADVPVAQQQGVPTPNVPGAASVAVQAAGDMAQTAVQRRGQDIAAGLERSRQQQAQLAQLSETLRALGDRRHADKIRQEQREMEAMIAAMEEEAGGDADGYSGLLWDISQMQSELDALGQLENSFRSLYLLNQMANMDPSKKGWQQASDILSKAIGVEPPTANQPKGQATATQPASADVTAPAATQPSTESRLLGTSATNNRLWAQGVKDLQEHASKYAEYSEIDLAGQMDPTAVLQQNLADGSLASGFGGISQSLDTMGAGGIARMLEQYTSTFGGKSPDQITTRDVQLPSSVSYAGYRWTMGYAAALGEALDSGQIPPEMQDQARSLLNNIGRMGINYVKTQGRQTNLARRLDDLGQSGLWDLAMQDPLQALEAVSGARSALRERIKQLPIGQFAQMRAEDRKYLSGLRRQQWQAIARRDWSAFEAAGNQRWDYLISTPKRIQERFGTVFGGDWTQGQKDQQLLQTARGRTPGDIERENRDFPQFQGAAPDAQEAFRGYDAGMTKMGPASQPANQVQEAFSPASFDKEEMGY